MEHFISEHIEIGKFGEAIACKYLKSKGYKIIERNFRKKWGEIDIICKKDCLANNFKKREAGGGFIFANLIKHIFSKSLCLLRNVLYGTTCDLNDNVSFDKIIFVEVKTLKSNNKSLNPEDNVTKSKQKKLIRTCELYLASKKFPIDTDWQIDVVAIKLDRDNKKATINHIENAVYY